MTSATGTVGTSLASQDWTNVFESTDILRTANGSLLHEHDDGATLFKATRWGERGPSDVEALSGGQHDLQWDIGGRLEADESYDHTWTGRGEWLGAKSRPGVDAPERTVRRDAFGRAVRSVYSDERGEVVVDHVFIGPHVVEDRYSEGGTPCLVRTNHYDASLDASVGHTIERLDECSFALEIAGVSEAIVNVGETRTFGHVRDLGRNVVAVVDESGTVVERYAYAAHGESVDPTTGAPLSCGATCGSVAGTVVGYRSMRRLGYGDAYDARFRVYDTRLRQFWSMDPLGWVDGYDRWMYVGGDAVNGWDPWGLADELSFEDVDYETLATHAMMLEGASVAGPGGVLPDGNPMVRLTDAEIWDLGLDANIVLGRDPWYTDPNTSFDVAFYWAPVGADGANALVVAFEGSQERVDWSTNALNAVAVDNILPDVHSNAAWGQYDDAIALGRHIRDTLGGTDIEIYFAGFSLGGGLATAAGAAAGRPVVAANPAGVSNHALSRAFGNGFVLGLTRLSRGQKDWLDRNVHSYFVPGDFVNWLNGWPVLSSTVGRRIRLVDGDYGGSGARHIWTGFEAAMNASMVQHPERPPLAECR